jgi:hypothetical protein
MPSVETVSCHFKGLERRPMLKKVHIITWVTAEVFA